MIRMIRDGEAPMGPTATYATVPCAVGRRHAFALREAPPSPPRPRLLDRVRAAARLRHDSRRTGAASVAWVRSRVKAALTSFVTPPVHSGETIGPGLLTALLRDCEIERDDFSALL